MIRLDFTLREARSGIARTGLALFGLTLTIALFGPLVSPHSPTEFVGTPLSGPSAQFPLGTDVLGRDMLSRVLHGGDTLIGLATLATVSGAAVGLLAGMIAGLNRALIDRIIMRGIDVLLAFPGLVLLLLLVASLGPGGRTAVIAVAMINIPGSTRIVRAATVEVAVKAYVEAARLRGESTFGIAIREVLPNILAAIAADLGTRFTLSVLIIAGANFLGLGLQPPTSDWGLMVAENRASLELQPWAVLVPAFLIAILTISINLVADSMLQRFDAAKDFLS